MAHLTSGTAVPPKMHVCPSVSRYLRRLHFSLKKGRWSPKEEEQLLELIKKHGVGESCGRPRTGGGGVPPLRQVTVTGKRRRR